ncbi:COPI associated protein-domain-containing protein [Mycotypha africana]|uniref:COPI associated protein-domain-containing protein n=1 Tax=Mycotypha africana TaxID=64632 RepID=UPI0023006E56|nr:COPI associated protein-domain-containing protein [Mycotypha africana]KAI8975538.1 COPI associated protein-domain-containing protein [Mycotypha africana]
MNLSFVFRVLNIIVAAFMIIGGVMTCFAGGFPNFIQGIFVIIFGIVTALFEFRLPAVVTQFASFMFSFMGRAIFYIFIGCITLSYGHLAIASGVIIVVIGLVYLVLHFFKKIDAPSNMQRQAYEDALSGLSSTKTSANNSTLPTTHQPNPYPQSTFPPTSAPQTAYPQNTYPHTHADGTNPTYPPVNFNHQGAI